MLSVEQAKYAQKYQFKNGMVNVVWLAGLLRRVNAARTEGYIQRSNNLNQLLHFKCEAGDTIPHTLKDGEPIKIIARLRSANADGEYSVDLVVLKFDRPSIFDMPPRKAWERQLPDGVPRDSVEPPAFGDDPEVVEKMNGETFTDTSNTVEIAGYLCGLTFEQPTKTGGNGSLVVHLRQTKNSDEVIVCRTNTRDARHAYRLMALGDALYARGKMAVRLKNTGEAAGPDGILPTRRVQHVQVSVWSPASESQITVVPPWVDEMREARNSARQRKANASGEAAEMKTGTRIEREEQAQLPVATMQAVEAPITASQQVEQAAQAAVPSSHAEVSSEVLSFLQTK